MSTPELVSLCASIIFAHDVDRRLCPGDAARNAVGIAHELVQRAMSMNGISAEDLRRELREPGPQIDSDRVQHTSPQGGGQWYMRPCNCAGYPCKHVLSEG